jgi:SAM-dependent methyltransferase
VLDENRVAERAVAVGALSTSQPQAWLSETQLAFDSVATSYDRSNAENPILRAMRRRVMAAVVAHAPPGGHILDLGCGPGTDEETLAAAGFAVTAIDWSPAMVDETRRRVASRNLQSRVVVHHRGIHELDGLPPATFDAACSNFGPLNCVLDLPRAAQLIADRVRPGGLLIASVIGRVCPWEMVRYALRRDWPRLRIRFADGPVPVPLNGRTVWTTYYTPREFERPFVAAGFTRVTVRTLGLFMPPPYMDGFAARHPAALALLSRVEDHLGRLPILRSSGDHFLIVMRKASACGHADPSTTLRVVLSKAEGRAEDEQIRGEASACFD